MIILSIYADRRDDYYEFLLIQVKAHLLNHLYMMIVFYLFHSRFTTTEEADMRCMFALVNSGHYEDNDLFDPEAEEERQYADYDEAINDTEIVDCVATEPLYEDDDYAHEDHTDSKFDDCRAMWPGGGPMPHEKAELEIVYFTGSNSGANIQG